MTVVDGERDRLASRNGHDGRQSTGDQYTMAEAAKLKGVSYHTVSRAVRSGRLPVHRLGRMALIGEDDLRAWHPMRERAPKRYRQREPSAEATPALVDLASGERVALAQQLAALCEIIHMAAAEQSEDDFAALVCERFSERLNLPRITIWRFDPHHHVADRVALRGDRMSPLPDRLQIPAVAGEPLIRTVRVVPDIAELWPDIRKWTDAPMARPTFIAPLVVGGQRVGMIIGDRAGEPIELSADEMALAQGLASQVALAFENNRLRRQAANRATELETTVEGLFNAVIACDLAGHITVFNEAARRLLGPGAADLPLGANMDELLTTGVRLRSDGETMSLAQLPLRRALAGDELRDLPMAVERADGSERQIWLSARPLRIDDQITGAIAIGQDVTSTDCQPGGRAPLMIRAVRRADAVSALMLDLLRAETMAALLNQAVTGMSALLDVDNGAIYLRDEDGRLRLRAAWGQEPAAVVQRPFDLVALPNTVMALAHGKPLALDLEEASATEAEAMESFGAKIALIVPLLATERELGVGYFHYRDARRVSADDLAFAGVLSERVSAVIEQEQRIGAARLATDRLLRAMDQLPVAVLIMEYPAGDVVLANRDARRLLQLPPDGQRIEAADVEFVDDDDLIIPAEQHPLLRSLRTGRELFGEPLTIRRPDGSLVEVLANHAPILDEQGNVHGAVSLLQDRARFKPLDQEKDEFLSVVAHELRNPLTSMRGNLQLLQRKVARSTSDMKEEELQRLETVLDQTDRISELIGRLLDMSRADPSKIDLSLGESDAVMLVEAVSNEARGGLEGDRTIEIRTPERCHVVWDEVRIEQILTNLLTNASRYGEQGPIEVTLAPSADTVRISVRDHGPGVPPRVKRRIFRRSYRSGGASDMISEPGQSTSGKGLGIGLYISSRLAKAHGGWLEARDAPGGGAEFILTLPGVVIP